MTKLQLTIDAQQLNRRVFTSTDITINGTELSIFVDNIPEDQSECIDRLSAQVYDLNDEISELRADLVFMKTHSEKCADQITSLLNNENNLGLARKVLAEFVKDGKFYLISKICAIKMVRAMTGLGLKEAKALADEFEPPVFYPNFPPAAKVSANGDTAADVKVAINGLVRQHLAS